jgi:hypothetical protein
VSRSVKWATSRGELLQKGLLGQPHRLFEAGADALLFPVVDLRAQAHQVAGRLHGGEIPLDSEQAAHLGRVVGRVIQATQAGAGVGPDLVVDGVEVGLGLD